VIVGGRRTGLVRDYQTDQSGRVTAPIPCDAGSTGRTFRETPGIYQVQTKSLKVSNVAGRQGRLAGGGNAGDLDVAHFDRPARAPVLRSDSTGELSSGRIEGQYTVLEVFLERLGEGGLQKSSAPSSRE
jgi:hypothetical protein